MNRSSPGHALVHVPPVTRELTGSWLRRVALACGLPAQNLVRGILSGTQTVHITGTPKTALEAYFNAPARAALARFTSIPLSRLYGLLPELGPTHSRLRDDKGTQAAWYSPARAWVTACPPCTPRAWSPQQPVLLYPGAVGHICRRHRRWLLADENGPASVPLGTLPEVLAAHREHVALAHNAPGATGALTVAAAVVWSWQAQRWHGDSLWSQRTSALASLTGCSPAGAAAHSLIAYPETVRVATLLSDQAWQRQLREAASKQGMQAAHALALVGIGQRIGRPWLADWLTAIPRTRRLDPGEHDPLKWWLGCLTGPDTPAGVLWCVPNTLGRPVEYSDRLSFLTEARVRSVIGDARTASLTGGWEPVPSRASPAAWYRNGQ
ncbi:TniQ family protein [Streptomyces hydrogenans]|uniref:TniQ family protein n=1 Tax=Streptomyces hydrogenans TaxID=1873719 RepID=UPI0035DC6B3F